LLDREGNKQVMDAVEGLYMLWEEKKGDLKFSKQSENDYINEENKCYLFQFYTLP
jgi:hypothetical protein